MALKYSLIIEATADPAFFGFYSPELQGFTGAGTSIEDCLARAMVGMNEFVDELRARGLSVPPDAPNPRILIQQPPTVAEVTK